MPKVNKKPVNKSATINTKEEDIIKLLEKEEYIEKHIPYRPPYCKDAQLYTGKKPGGYKTFTLTLGKWAKKLGISYRSLYMRVKRYGRSFEKAINTPYKSRSNYFKNNPNRLGNPK